MMLFIKLRLLNDAEERVKRRGFLYGSRIWPTLASPASDSSDKLLSSRSVLTLFKLGSESRCRFLREYYNISFSFYAEIRSVQV